MSIKPNVRFKDLPDGAYFMLALTYPYGSFRIFQKVIEDGEHNAVWATASHVGELIPEDFMVLEVDKPEVN